MTTDELDAMFVDGRSSGQGDFVPIDFQAVVKARTGRNKVTVQVLWGEGVRFFVCGGLVYK